MYETLQQLSGAHPWRDVGPDGFVDYRARPRDGGRVFYFNYSLARDLQIVPANHASRMTAPLERAILDAFAIQIINEFDEQHADSRVIGAALDRTYMATRYLQAQHKDKRGLHSGDGRAIWNGQIKTTSTTYDISSRGTGATKLSPGAQIAGMPIKTGDDSWGYSCGRADLDEMLGTAMMSEIFHRNGVPTERTLAVIDFGDGSAIGVRAAPNLLRPAHIFRYLRQNNHDGTRAALDYFFARQSENQIWKLPTDRPERYRAGLKRIAAEYGTLAATLEAEYIFSWLAWDGDNLLASGAVLDYGSIRQFAAKHDKYRYDDVERFSTCLTEQKHWARRLVCMFAQATDFAQTGKRKRLQTFYKAKCLSIFDRAFEMESERRLLWKIGFDAAQICALMESSRAEISQLRRAVSHFENAKIAGGIEQVADGITHRPTFLARSLFRKLPEFYIEACASRLGATMPAALVCKLMAASYASRNDLQLSPLRKRRAMELQEIYQRLVDRAGPYSQVLRTLRQRAAVINHPHRITGNSVIKIVDEIMSAKNLLTQNQIQLAIDQLVESQVLIPSVRPSERASSDAITGPAGTLLRQLKNHLANFCEAI